MAATARKGEIHRATAPTAEDITPKNIGSRRTERHSPTTDEWPALQLDSRRVDCRLSAAGMEGTRMARLLRRPRSRGLGKRAWLVTWSIRLVLWTLGFTRIIKTEIVNADVGPGKGAVLLAANHMSMIDVFFILGALRREAIAMAMAELWKLPLTRWLVEVLGQIPVVRGDSESGKEAMESAAQALDDGAL